MMSLLFLRIWRKESQVMMSFGTLRRRSPSCVNPYEGRPVSSEFSSGPSDTFKFVLHDYPNHIARCVYDKFVSKN
jgi:hypothetical protein